MAGWTYDSAIAVAPAMPHRMHRLMSPGRHRRLAGQHALRPLPVAMSEFERRSSACAAHQFSTHLLLGNFSVSNDLALIAIDQRSGCGLCIQKRRAPLHGSRRAISTANPHRLPGSLLAKLYNCMDIFCSWLETTVWAAPWLLLLRPPFTWVTHPRPRFHSFQPPARHADVSAVRLCP